MSYGWVGGWVGGKRLRKGVWVFEFLGEEALGVGRWVGG